MEVVELEVEIGLEVEIQMEVGKKQYNVVAEVKEAVCVCV